MKAITITVSLAAPAAAGSWLSLPSSLSEMKAKPDPSLKLRSQTQLEALLKEVGARLGTSAERPGDMERARAVAHQLNNLLTGRGLLGEIAKLPRCKARPPGNQP